MTIKGKFAGQWLAAAGKCGGRGADAAGAERKLRASRTANHRGVAGRAAAGPVNAGQPTVRPVEEPRADVASRLASILVVNGVDLPVLVGRPTGGLYGCNEPVPGHVGVNNRCIGRAVVVLNLLYREEVR